jgi:hypothetical protein
MPKAKGCTWNELSPDDLARAEAALADLAALIKETDGKQWRAAEIALSLNEEFGLTVKAIHGRLGVYSYAYFADIVRTARCFRSPESRHGLAFCDCLLAMKQYVKYDDDGKAETTPTEIAQRAVSEGKTARMIRAEMSDRRLTKAKEAATSDAEGLFLRHPFLRSKAHHKDCRTLLSQLAISAPQTVKILHADFPYAAYDKTNDGRYCDSPAVAVMGLRNDCDNNNSEDAIALAVETIRLSPQVLSKGGVLLGWQAGGKPDRWQLTKAIEESGLDARAISVRKAGPQPGDFAHAVSISTERLLVIFRKGEIPINHGGNGMDRSDYIDVAQLEAEIDGRNFPWPGKLYRHRLSQSVGVIGDTHAMQKDESLCRFLVEKFSFPGELCVDLCGCSGSFSIAAAQSRREWIYCESNKSNFDFGLARIGKALGYLTAKTA